MPTLGDSKGSSRTTAADYKTTAGGCGRASRILMRSYREQRMSGTDCEGDEDLTTLVEGDSGRDGDESELDREAIEDERGRLRVSIQVKLLSAHFALRIVLVSSR